MEVFLSYIPETHEEFAKQLKKALLDNDITPLSFNLKETYADGIFDCLDRLPFNSDRFIVIVSKDYQASDWHTKELTAFFMKEKNGNHKGLIVPVLAEIDVKMPPLLDGRLPVHNFGGVLFEDAFQKLVIHLRESPSRARQVFVIMKFPDPQHIDRVLDPLLERAYTKAIAPAITKAGYVPIRIDQNENAGFIPLQILEQIKASDIVLADLTGERPNCYFEAGFAQGLGKEMILTIGDSRVHFDLAGNNIIHWRTPAKLLTALSKRFEAIEKRRKPRRRKRLPHVKVDQG